MSKRNSATSIYLGRRAAFLATLVSSSLRLDRLRAKHASLGLPTTKGKRIYVTLVHPACIRHYKTRPRHPVSGRAGWASTVGRLQEARRHSQGLAELVLPFSVVVTASLIHGLQPLSAFFVCSVSSVALLAVCSCPDAWVVVGVLLCLVLTAFTDLSGEEASYFWRELDLMTFLIIVIPLSVLAHADTVTVSL